MNYQAHYDRLVDRAKQRTYAEGVYTERHHILPKCMGGDDSISNLVNLLPGEHLFAHRLLCRIYPNRPGLAYAVSKLAGGRIGRESRRLYEMDRKRYSWVARNPSAETRAKLSNAAKNCSPEKRAKLSAAALKQKEFSPETRAKLVAAQRNKAPMSKEARAKISEARRNRPTSPETRAKLSAISKKQQAELRARRNTDTSLSATVSP
jgi:hypothetical protein